MDFLPPELLSSSFLALLPIPSCVLGGDVEGLARRRSQDITNLRLVSKAWNSNILNTPKIWSYITVTPRRTDALRYLPRSRAAPLHVRFEIWPANNPGNLRAAVEALWSEANRWTTYFAFTLGTRESYPWFKLMPPSPVPRLQEARLRGDGTVEIHGSELQRLHEWGFKSSFRLNGAPALRIWVTKRPTNHQEWEQFLLISQQCPLLESLRLTECPISGMTPSEIEETFPGAGAGRPTFSNLKELELVSKQVALDIITYLDAPALRLLVIQRHNSPLHFIIPPACYRLRFTHVKHVNAIQETLTTFPPAQLQSLAVEIEDDELIRRPTGDGECERRIQWLEQHVSLTWFGIPDEQKPRCDCRNEHPE